MRTATKTILLIAVLALLTASCSTSESAGAAAAVASTTILNTTTAVPPPDPAEGAAATQEANIEAFLAQDMHDSQDLPGSLQQLAQLVGSLHLPDTAGQPGE